MEVRLSYAILDYFGVCDLLIMATKATTRNTINKT